MGKMIACGVLVGALAIPVLAGGEKRVTYVDLGPAANQKLKETLGTVQGNDLAALPTGEQTLAGVKFKIGPSLIHLTGKHPAVASKPETAEGLKVNAKFSKLHILHACQFPAKDGAIVGYYTVNYDDKSQETIPIVYGKDILNWWYTADSKEPTRGKVAWKGDNEQAKGKEAKIRLYLTTWKNPEPTRKVVSIDFGSTNAEEAAPFCVAITAEE